MDSKSNIEGMKNKPAGGADRAAFGQNVQPTNSSLVGRLGSMLSAIKHGGKPEAGSKMPFSK